MKTPPGKAGAPAAVTDGGAGRTSLRALGYVRVSTQRQAERGMGLQAQVRSVREYARDQRLELLDVVEERGSGAVKDGEFSSVEHRPVLRALLDGAERGEFGALVVASFDRLSRDQLDAQLIKRWFAKFGVAVLSAAGETNGAEGALAELIDRLLGAIHDFDRKRILERVAAGKTEKKTLGRHVHGRAPYGYRSNEGVLTPVPDMIPTVRRIFERARAGDSPGQIARALNADLVPAPQGDRWTEQGVRVLLTNVAYAGERYRVKGAHESIISRRTFNAANAALQARAEEWRAKRQRRA